MRVYRERNKQICLAYVMYLYVIAVLIRIRTGTGVKK